MAEGVGRSASTLSPTVRRIANRCGWKHRSQRCDPLKPAFQGVHNEVGFSQCIGHREGRTTIGFVKLHCELTLMERKTGLLIVQNLSKRSPAESMSRCQR
jgi:hypothetical protein